MFGRLKRIHFIGVGGVGMSGLAILLHNLGFEVTGSDIKESETTRKLTASGIKVAIGHTPENTQGAEVVVYSTAIPQDNPELQFAQARGMVVIKRAEMLAELMRLKFSIAIAGSHGKTTTTSLVTHILFRAGLDPTAVIGGRIVGDDTGARLGRSEYLVAEADESDRSFLLLYPAIAVVTNIEEEHLDFYRNLADLRREFIKFVNRVPFYGTVILGIDCPAVRQIRAKVKRKVLTYALNQPADFLAKDLQLYRFSSAWTLLFNSKEVGRFSLPMPGRHNVSNALAAIAVATELGVDFKTIEQALNTFTGVHRRMEKRGEKHGVIIYDDYGHHPTEVKVTLEALRTAYPEDRIIVVFQPHRYTRTKLLAQEFGKSFDQADEVIITRIYPAAEPPIPNVDELLIVQEIQKNSRPGLIVHHIPELNQVPDFLKRLTADSRYQKTIILTLGAGSITHLAEEILKQMTADSGQPTADSRREVEAEAKESKPKP